MRKVWTSVLANGWCRNGGLRQCPCLRVQRRAPDWRHRDHVVLYGLCASRSRGTSEGGQLPCLEQRVLQERLRGATYTRSDPGDSPDWQEGQWLTDLIDQTTASGIRSTHFNELDSDSLGQRQRGRGRAVQRTLRQTFNGVARCSISSMTITRVNLAATNCGRAMDSTMAALHGTKAEPLRRITCPETGDPSALVLASFARDE